MKKFFIRNRKLCIATLFLVIYFPALSLATFNCWRIYNIGKESFQEQSMFLAKLTVIRQEQFINETREALSFLSILPQFKEEKIFECDKTLTDFLNKHEEYTNIVLFGTDGNIICSGINFDQSSNFFYRPYFQKMLKEKDFIVGKYLVGAITNKPVVPFIQPIFNSQGEIVRAVAAFRDLSWLQEFNSKVSLPREVSMLIFDGNGTILDCFSEENDCVGKNIKEKSLAQEAFKNEDEFMTFTEGLKGIKKKYTVIPVSPDSSQDKIYIAVGINNKLPLSIIFSSLLPNLVLLLAVAFLAWLVAKKECISCNLPNTSKDSMKE